MPLNPVSYRIFSPFVFNPAMAGCKDYSSINVIAAFHNKTTSQILSGDTRLSKKGPVYFSSPETKQFSNIGIGGAFFNDLNNASRNVGGAFAASYHIPVSKNNLSFLSFGGTIKGVYNTITNDASSDSLLAIPPKKTFYPNMDLGVYFYNSNFHIGVSSTNIAGNPEAPDSLGRYEIPVSRQFHFQTGYKILLQRSMGIVLEPSVIFETDSFNSIKLFENVNPVVKLYLKDFCIGTYFNDRNSTSFFFQYKYPGVYLGAYLIIPKNSAFYIREPVIELTAGLNIKGKKTRSTNQSSW